MDTVFDCVMHYVMHYIHDANDRNSFSLVSRTCYDVDAKTLIRDLELLARSRGETLRVLEIDSCSGFSTDGLLYIGKYCNHLRILSLENSSISEKDGEWLHELALHNNSIESLNFYKAGLTKFDVKDLALVAKNCSQSLVSVKISEHYDFIDLVEFFSYAVNLEDFGGGRFGDSNPILHISAQRAKYKDFKFPPNLKYLALNHMGQKDTVLPFAHLITQLDTQLNTQFVYDRRHHHHQNQHSLIENCPNLEVLYTPSISNKGLEQLSHYCKNLRKLYVTNKTGLTERGASMKDSVIDNGIRSLLIGCNKLERLSICFQKLGGLSDI
ncbi:coronatine-insensitive protein 1-like protein, partial [Tanacetum coccineum]